MAFRGLSVVCVSIVTACATDAAVAGSDQAPNPSASTAEESLESFVRQHRIDQVIPSLSFAVARGEDIILTGSYGFQDHDGEEPTTAETSYLVASISKTFAAATLLAMEAKGHIRLNEDFTTFSEWDRRCEGLVSSGSIFGGAVLDDLTIPPLDCDATITLEDVLSHRVNGVPGADFIYNPVIFGRLSNYVEEKTGRSWRSWMREYVIDAGKLDGIAAGWRDADAADVLTHFAPPFRRIESESGRGRFESSVLPNTELNASSGIIASPTALVRYGSALMRGEILPKDLLDRMWNPKSGASGTPEPYGLGWYVEEINGRKVVWHGGWWPDAYAGFLIIVPEEALVIAVLGNSDGLHWGNPLNGADIGSSPLAAQFFAEFLD